MATTSPTTQEPVSVGNGEQQIQHLDSLLRCGICFDYFNIAMIIPQCSHNYCSLCIRKYLSYRTQCPTCCMAVAEPDLRNNRILDDLVKAFVSARKHLSKVILDSPPMSPQNPSLSKFETELQRFTRKQENKLIHNFLVKGNNLKTKGNSKAFKEGCDASPCSVRTLSIQTPKKAESIKTELLECIDMPSTSCPATPSPVSKVYVKVDCPVCGVSIPEQYINKHLDCCLTREEKIDSLRSSVQKRKPMAKVVYNLLTERDLKKRLKEVGLSTHGTKQQMIKRHQEFLHMYNAQCDSLVPKPGTSFTNVLVHACEGCLSSRSW
ncbi:hypothetical protein GDO86_007237 [Hymenochirus boettgeri]|uniref:RING-type E3 ubiquitin transferase n=1 Tax=Hymenochirus boettgeri TaxID=247094 RepID=A0A8T2J103_9PIPI|nr:hypothetical protein GDO86_007237 [Hymenochirus boettgeri]